MLKSETKFQMNLIKYLLLFLSLLFLLINGEDTSDRSLDEQTVVTPETVAAEDL